MLKIGITGGIGSGKSTICTLFEIIGIPVFYADDSGRYLLENDPEVKSAVTALLGTQAYADDGRPNRKWIAEMVFKDESQLQALNRIIHPAVHKAFENWVSRQRSPYVLKEAAIMFESGSYRGNDLNILVSSPLDLRIQRIMKRDLTSRESILQRIAKQMPEEEKKLLSDFLIENNSEVLLIPQVIHLHQHFLSLSQQV